MGFLPGILLCNSGGYEGIFCGHISCLGINSPSTHICYIKELFRIICVIVSGRILGFSGEGNLRSCSKFWVGLRGRGRRGGAQ